MDLFVPNRRIHSPPEKFSLTSPPFFDLQIVFLVHHLQLVPFLLTFPSPFLNLPLPWKYGRRRLPLGRFHLLPFLTDALGVFLSSSSFPYDHAFSLYLFLCCLNIAATSPPPLIPFPFLVRGHPHTALGHHLPLFFFFSPFRSLPNFCSKLRCLTLFLPPFQLFNLAFSASPRALTL